MNKKPVGKIKLYDVYMAYSHELTGKALYSAASPYIKTKAQSQTDLESIASIRDVRSNGAREASDMINSLSSAGTDLSANNQNIRKKVSALISVTNVGLCLVAVIPVINNLVGNGASTAGLSQLAALVPLPSSALAGGTVMVNTALQSIVLGFFPGYLKTISNILGLLSGTFCMTSDRLQSTSVCNLTAVITQVNFITNQVNTLDTTIPMVVSSIRTYTLFIICSNGI